jgi:hypothetical protein
MPSVSILVLFSLGLSVALSLVFSRALRRRKQRPVPPGPPGWPILGNVFDMATRKDTAKRYLFPNVENAT